MNKLKVTAVGDYGVTFENGLHLSSNHDSDCCESHELYFKDLSLADFAGLEFDLSNDNFFKRVPDYGIELLPLVGWPVRVAGHGYNNGYYSDKLDLVLEGKVDGKDFKKVYDITECQEQHG
jgi:hypothetical protein